VQQTPDKIYMARVLELAQKGLGKVAPNPLVGCVIVHNNRIIGEGYHREFGKAHAEVNAIDSVHQKELLEESTLYVNLEPCSHYGKTPPCAELLIKYRLKRVVVGIEDPFPLVAGKGLTMLREAGIEVDVNVMAAECRFINRRFLTFIQQKRPFIILKWAQSADGYLDKERKPGEEGINWITGGAAKRLNHQWRASEQSILIGKKTALTDNPSLTAREVNGKNPTRILIDLHQTVPFDKVIFDSQAPTLLICDDRKEIKNLPDSVQLIRINSNENIIAQLLNELFLRNIQSVIIEGGAYTLNSFIESDFWDEARVFTGNIKFISGVNAPLIEVLPAITEKIGEDQLQTFFNPNNSILAGAYFGSGFGTDSKLT
jgi:diaminohydroxyphosphoribosylaminopyrimidine deaminase / 5-amino-6-(5-phosphoribosylamino)uracil reductase